MERNPTERSKLRHDFRNDIYCLKLNLDTLSLLRDDPAEFQQLVELMKATIESCASRIEATLDLIPDTSDPDTGHHVQ